MIERTEGAGVTPTITCPGCSQEMVAQPLDAHYGRSVTIDLCRPCGAFWFDTNESIALAPGAVLRLFVVISESSSERRPLSDSPTCPRCRGSLQETSDIQRGIHFRYWRCQAEHGRFISFAEFLREKNFVRPLAGDELKKLRANVKMLHCSSCGAPIDLTRTSICDHCRAPVSILDSEQVRKVVAELKEAEAKRHTVDPMLALRLIEDRLHTEAVFSKMEPSRRWAALSDHAPDYNAPDLLETSLAALAKLLLPSNAH